MATFEVCVPVKGEIIFTVEANDIRQAADIASTLDWSDGELNVEQDDDSPEGTRVELIDGVEGDLDDDDAETLLLNGVTLNTETGQPYAMRHFQP